MRRYSEHQTGPDDVDEEGLARRHTGRTMSPHGCRKAYREQSNNAQIIHGDVRTTRVRLATDNAAEGQWGKQTFLNREGQPKSLKNECKETAESASRVNCRYLHSETLKCNILW